MLCNNKAIGREDNVNYFMQTSNQRRIEDGRNEKTGIILWTA